MQHGYSLLAFVDVFNNDHKGLLKTNYITSEVTSRALYYTNGEDAFVTYPIPTFVTFPYL